jgi:hypothetical protein
MPGLLDIPLDVLDVETPSLRLLEEVGYWSGGVESESGGVEGVLRNGDEDAILGRGNKGLEEVGDTGGSAGSDVDLRWRGRVAVTLCENDAVSRLNEKRGRGRERKRDELSMKLAMRFRIAGTPIECEYAPVLPISSMMVRARLIAS